MPWTVTQRLVLPACRIAGVSAAKPRTSVPLLPLCIDLPLFVTLVRMSLYSLY